MCATGSISKILNYQQTQLGTCYRKMDIQYIYICIPLRNTTLCPKNILCIILTMKHWHEYSLCILGFSNCINEF